MTRIAGTRTGHASWETEFAIGHHDCKACGAETPAPPQSVLDKRAADGHIGTVWPHEHWTVPGWNRLNELGWICDRCARAVMLVLQNRRKAVAGPLDCSDLQIIEGNVARAIELGDDGLSTGFPAHPIIVTGEERALAGMLRGVIRKMRNALLGIVGDE